MPASQPVAAEPRQVMKFDWGKVPDAIVKELLEVAYDASDEDMPALRTPEQRRRQAARIYGTPVSTARLNDIPRWAAWNVLTQTWVQRHATRTQLEDFALELSHGKPSRDRYRLDGPTPVKTWFAGLRTSATFRRLALKHFRAAYKSRQDVTRSHLGEPGEPGVYSVKVTMQGSDQPRLSPYPHQQSAWDALDSMWAAHNPERRRGLVVLPTGAGKTVTAAAWIVDRMTRDKNLRVLWIAHQEELLTQAADTFMTLAAQQPADFRRQLRVISGGNSAVTTLDEWELDVAIVTWQSLHRSWATTRRLVDTYLQKKTIVVVDEAHHAGADSYQDILHRVISRDPAPRMVLGLTATPWPQGASAARMRDVFPRDVIAVTPETLHASQILATPILYTVDTKVPIELTEDELKASYGDLPPAVLRRLRGGARDEVLLQMWQQYRKRWGKTLVFAATVRHADDLGDAFAARGAKVRVLHSAAERPRSETLAWFRNHTGSAVLVSVGMLTEGVDLPDATTAFLARPTTSPILLRQMIGRVLRGPAAGGSTIAHVVYLRDAWLNFDDVMEPAELPDLAASVAVTEEGLPLRRMPPVTTDDGKAEIGEDLLAQIERMYKHRTGRIPLDSATSITRLCGFYQTSERNIPVMEHQRAGFEELIGSWLRGTDHRGRPALSFFDDIHPPYPTERALRALSDFVSTNREAPQFHPLVASVDLREVAEKYLALPALTAKQRTDWLRGAFEARLARVAYRTFEHFEEAVDQQVREIQRHGRTGLGNASAERILDRSSKGQLPRLRSRTTRDVPDLDGVIADMRNLFLGEEVLSWMPADEDLPTLEWTRRPIAHAWAYWSLKTTGQRRGKAVIRLNRALQAPATQIKDELLRYLVFHEMLHDLLPGRGHDAEFRRLEAMWPDAQRLDRELDTLHETWDLSRPSGSG